jgi:hypothetical protein
MRRRAAVRGCHLPHVNEALAPPRFTPPTSRQDIFDHVTMDVGQTEVAALKPVSQPGVVDPQKVEHGRLKIVDVDRVAGDVVAEVTAGAWLMVCIDGRCGKAPTGMKYCILISWFFCFAGTPVNNRNARQQKVHGEMVILMTILLNNGRLGTATRFW